MKENFSSILAALNSDQLGVFFLVQLDWNSQYRYTTLPYDVVWNGNTYQSEENIISFESPRATNVVDRQAYKLQLSGIDPDMMAEINSGVNNMPVSIKLGFTDEGVPGLGLLDIMHVYSGTVANVKKSILDSEQIFTIECSAPLSSLDAKSTLFTTRDAMRSFDPLDTSFDQIATDATEMELLWGKNDPNYVPPPLPPVDNRNLFGSVIARAMAEKFQNTSGGTITGTF